MRIILRLTSGDIIGNGDSFFREARPRPLRLCRGRPPLSADSSGTIISSEPYKFAFSHTQKRNTRPCSHQSTSGSVISPFRFAACLSMPSTHRGRRAQKGRRRRIAPYRRDSPAWRYQDFGAGTTLVKTPFNTRTWSSDLRRCGKLRK